MFRMFFCSKASRVASWPGTLHGVIPAPLSLLIITTRLITHLTWIQHRIKSDVDLHSGGCQGKNMRRGCEIGDYKVTVGSELLYNDELYDDRLIVRLLNVDRYERSDVASCGLLYSVRVRTANTLPMKCACLSSPLYLSTSQYSPTRQLFTVKRVLFPPVCVSVCTYKS